MIRLGMDKTVVLDYKENYKIILRKEQFGFCVVNPITLEKIMLNESGAYILKSYLSGKSKDDVITELRSIIPISCIELDDWIEEFEHYLVLKKFI